MPTLDEVYASQNVSATHREFVFDKLRTLLRGKSGSRQELFDLLRVVYLHYDNGGHSSGRSRRSRLLGSCMTILRSKKIPAKDWRELKQKITILVSMYHDDSYIIKMGWYDYVDDEFGLISSVQERVHLMAVFRLLGLTELTSDYDEEQ